MRDIDTLDSLRAERDQARRIAAGAIRDAYAATAERDQARRRVAELEQEHAELLNALADVVTKATDFGEQDDGFVSHYLLPTGPIHRAIPLLQRLGFTARPRREV